MATQLLCESVLVESEISSAQNCAVLCIYLFIMKFVTHMPKNPHFTRWAYEAKTGCFQH